MDRSHRCSQDSLRPRRLWRRPRRPSRSLARCRSNPRLGSRGSRSRRGASPSAFRARGGRVRETPSVAMAAGCGGERARIAAARARRGPRSSRFPRTKFRTSFRRRVAATTTSRRRSAVPSRSCGTASSTGSLYGRAVGETHANLPGGRVHRRAGAEHPARDLPHGEIHGAVGESMRPTTKTRQPREPFSRGCRSLVRQLPHAAPGIASRIFRASRSTCDTTASSTSPRDGISARRGRKACASAAHR